MMSKTNLKSMRYLKDVAKIANFSPKIGNCYFSAQPSNWHNSVNFSSDFDILFFERLVFFRQIE